MERIFNTLASLCNTSTVSGYEMMGESTIRELASPLFDEIVEDKMGGFVLIKKSKMPNAKRLLIDAHYDNVGMMVTGILKGGFLKFCPIGGLDARVLPATEVIVHGKKDIYGIVTSTPPHLRKAGENKAPRLEGLMIDTGYSKKELEKIVNIGDVISYKNEVTLLKNNYVVANGLDDKACLCAILEAFNMLDGDKLQYDVYVTASAQEETGKAGCARVAFLVKPDIAISTDVNFALTEEKEDFDSIVCGKGASIDLSSATNRSLSKNVMRLLTKEKLPYQVVCEPSSTSTNNDPLSINGEGIRTLLMSIPLKSMHTPGEVIKLDDIKALAMDLLAIMCCEEAL